MKLSCKHCGGHHEVGVGTLEAITQPIAQAVSPQVENLKQWVNSQPHVHADKSPWLVKGVKKWIWVLLGKGYSLFHAGDTRSRAELEFLLGRSFAGVLSSDDFSVYNGYPVSAQQKYLAHLQRHFRQLSRLGFPHQTELGQAFLNLIDEAFTQHRQWRETSEASVYASWASFFKKRITQALDTWRSRAGHAASLLLKSLENKYIIMITYLFPGQGSQTKGMGKQLFARFPEETEIASDILGYSIVQLCTEDPTNQLDQTQFTQPALFVVNALSYKQRLIETGLLPDFLAGHSLGEYNALHSSGCFSFEDGIRLVTMRGRLMSRASHGTMAAVIGPAASDIQAILDFHKLSRVYIANYNSPDQTVVSGLEVDIDKLRQLLVDAGAICIPLKTSGAFHSPYMVSAGEKFAQYLENFSFSKLTIPVVCNVNGRPYQQEAIASQLAAQITSPVRWSESIGYLLYQDEMQFEELGVGRILSKLIPTIRQEYHAQQYDTPKDSNNQHDHPVDLSSVSRFCMKDAHSEIELVSQFSTQFTVDKEKLAAEARKKVDRWNRLYPVGTKVRVPGYEMELTTCTPAVILFRHRAAVYMENHNGYFALDEISHAER